jgi:isopenicillin N synthase-like dioxygenase
LEQVGFYYICGHGIPQDLIDHVFVACARFHAQPFAAKMACGPTSTMSATCR